MEENVSFESQEDSLLGDRDVVVEAETKPKSVAAEVVVIEPRGYVGIDCLIEQLVNQTIGDGYLFNLLIVGEPGVGKSTLIDSLLDLKGRREGPPLGDDLEQSPSCSPRLELTSFQLQEKHVKISLNVIETKDFGNGINNSDCFQSVVEYIDLQMEKRLNEELNIYREPDFARKDSLIHCCLYLLPPIALRPIDVIIMKALQDKINLIPIIAKADGLTQTELLALKQTIRREIDSNHVQVYNFPSDDGEAGKLPYSVVASYDFYSVGKRLVRGRLYPWGLVEVENDSHSDTRQLRRKLFGENLEDMKESTLSSHYENYRVKKLQEIGFHGLLESPEVSIFRGSIDGEKNALLAQFKKEEEKLKQRLERRFKEKEDKLDDEIKRRLDIFEDENRKLEEEEQRIEQEEKALIDDMKALEERKRSAKSAKKNVMLVKVPGRSPPPVPMAAKPTSKSTSKFASTRSLFSKSKPKK